jgi:nitrite reductase/ring-hydroxylating ferredoxin subunit
MIAVMRARDLKSRPHRLMWEGLPVVLFRTGSGVAALSDICPHRQAPLSMGQVAGDQIECPYHGWRFDGTGLCRAIAGLVTQPPRIRVANYRAVEHEGLIFLGKTDDTTEPYVSALWGQGTAMAVRKSRVESTLIEVAENILDATHTHYVHKGLLRGLSHKRYRVKVTVTGGPGWVEARYEGEDRQEGLVSRLLEGERATSVGRFIAPGVVELEFRSSHGINLCTSFHLRQAEASVVEGLGLFSGPLEGGLGWLKGMAFMPLFAVGLRQDQRMLKAAQANRMMGGDVKPVIGPLDVLRGDIEAILRGELPASAETPRTYEIML